MNGVNDQISVNIHISVNMLKNRIDRYLGKAAHTWNSTCELSMSQGLRFPLRSKE